MVSKKKKELIAWGMNLSVPLMEHYDALYGEGKPHHLRCPICHGVAFMTYGNGEIWCPNCDHFYKGLKVI